jgi:hypothetical protein
VTGGSVLIDSSAWIEAMRRDGDVVLRGQVRDAVRNGRARFCDLVRLELWNGVGGDAERRWLTEMESVVDTVPTTDEVWQQARTLAAATRRQEVAIPATDLLIAACARVHGLHLLHRDAHFDLLAQTPS